jgi:hypothetical protein
MLNSLLWLSLIATALFLIVGFVYGEFAFVFPVMFLICFFLMYGVYIFDAEDQAGANPELQKLPEPSTWSHIHNAWLYVNDSETWARYASFFSFFGGVICGSFVGMAVLTLLDVPSDALNVNSLLPGWISGVFLAMSAAIYMAKRG